ncbi:MAG: type I-E CRISPR-associated protein Cas7/Cse4/CasC, partial [Chloroflexota bacterium]|nr:type I-E CRISPR-associated protein Cas7/Cse4/CasC [Chloroflexota bacterium]
MNSIQIHAIQTLPPNCINRGEHGEPKSARYGGVRRARVSSQSWKRAMRKTGFVEQETGQPGAVRSRRLLDHLKEMLPEDKHDLAAQVIKDLYSADTVVLESKPIIDALVREVQTGSDAKAVVKAVATMPQVPDVAVYGRMIADYPSRNVDGALHVAHAISTHASMVDLDYFTAVDDLLPPGDTGAAHLDVAEFQAGTMYRYALLNLDQLHHNLEEPALVAPTVRGVLR